MTLEALARPALPTFLVLFALVAIAWPLVRLHRRTGEFGVALGGHARTTGGLVLGMTLVALAYALGVWVMLYALLGGAPLGVWPVPAWAAIVAGALMAVGLAVVVVAQAQMGGSWRIGIDDRPTGLIEHGLYALVRNPIYTGLLLALGGLTLLTPAPWTIAGLLLAAVLIAAQVRAEERHLIGLHGAGYRRYAARVGRFVPLLGRMRDGGSAA